MSRLWAALGSAAFFVLAPGCVVGLGPWWLTRWRLQPPVAGPLQQAMGAALLLVYAAVVWAAVAAFVYGYEEPTLRARYGAEYDAYRRAVPAWWPRLRPWRPTGSG